MFKLVLFQQSSRVVSSFQELTRVSTSQDDVYICHVVSQSVQSFYNTLALIRSDKLISLVYERRALWEKKKGQKSS